MTVSAELLAATVSIISDYREGEIARPDATHVDRWLTQFDETVREPLLTELNHVLSRTYVSKSGVEQFLSGLVSLSKLTGDKPRDFWLNANFLNLQERGNSQREFLSLFEIPLKQTTGLLLKDCGQQPTAYIYLDDGIFTGMTLIQSLSKWIKESAPPKATVHIIVIAGHAGGQYYAATNLRKAAAAAGKEIDLHWWALLALEDRKININTSDVLRPASLPDDAVTKAYAESLKFPPIYRTPGNVGEKKLFSSEEGRNLLEQQFLIKGAYIREQAPLLPKYARPLGDMVLETLGFGSTVVTYRNCPNNTPLAFWAGSPWYPLFARKTN